MQKKKALILFGPPAAGKGTLAALCNDHFNWKQLATGNLCREQIAHKTELGLQIEALISAGTLVPDKIIMEMIEQWIWNNKENLEGVIFDGTPRTSQQAKFVHDMLQDKFPDFDVLVIKFDIDEQYLFDRIATRLICTDKSCQAVYSLNNVKHKDTSSENFICEKCGSSLYKRCDDNSDSLKNRLRDYYNYEKDVLQFYKSIDHAVYSIDAKGSIESVFNQLKEIAGL